MFWTTARGASKTRLLIQQKYHALMNLNRGNVTQHLYPFARLCFSRLPAPT